MLLPATTGFGEATLVTVSSAAAVVPTTVDAVALLLLETGSFTEELTVAVSVITVPFAVPTFTFTTIEKLAAVLPNMFNVVQFADPSVSLRTKAILSQGEDPNGVRIELLALGPDSLHRKVMDAWK